MEATIIRWKRERKKFFIRIIVFSLIFFLSLPIGIGIFPEAFNSASPVWGISWAWLYAFLQVVMTWVIGWVYWIKAQHFDEIISKYPQEDTE